MNKPDILLRILEGIFMICIVIMMVLVMRGDTLVAVPLFILGLLWVCTQLWIGRQGNGVVRHDNWGSSISSKKSAASSMQGKNLRFISHSLKAAIFIVFLLLLILALNFRIWIELLIIPVVLIYFVYESRVLVCPNCGKPVSHHNPVLGSGPINGIPKTI